MEKDRKINLENQLESSIIILEDKGWWSYLTEYPILDHVLIINWLRKKGLMKQISIHYYFDFIENKWEILLISIEKNIHPVDLPVATKGV